MSLALSHAYLSKVVMYRWNVRKKKKSKIKIPAVIFATTTNIKLKKFRFKWTLIHFYFQKKYVYTFTNFCYINLSVKNRTYTTYFVLRKEYLRKFLWSVVLPYTKSFVYISDLNYLLDMVAVNLNQMMTDGDASSSEETVSQKEQIRKTEAKYVD